MKAVYTNHAQARKTLVFFLLVALSAYAEETTYKKPSILDALKQFAGYQLGGVRPVAESQNMLLIGAGHGRTGTSSLVKALDRLGLNSYHMKEGVFETSGHLDMWEQYYVRKTITFDDILDRISRDGFNATLDAPMNLHYQKVMQRYPDARVILTLRPSGAQGWVTSLTESVELFYEMLDRAPYRWIPRAKQLRKFFAAMNRDLQIPLDPVTDLPIKEYMAEAYDKWARDVITTVPKEKLLVFYAQDGWEPLCRFLSPASPVVERNCREVQEKGEAYPRVYEKNEVRKVALVLKGFSVIFETTSFLIVTFVLYRLLQLRKPKAKTI